MTDNRVITVGGIWAEGAEDIPEGTPTPSVTYADSGIAEEEIQL